MEKIMNEENDWDHNVEEDAVEGPVVCVNREQVLQALNEIRKSFWPFRRILLLIAANWGVGIQVIAEICQSPRRIWNAS